MKSFIKTMKALSDPSRVRVLKLLERRELCVCEVQELLGLSQSTVSRHLKQLEEAELACSRKEGSWLYYRLAGTFASPYAGEMLRLLSGWHSEDVELQKMLGRLATLDRKQLCS